MDGGQGFWVSFDRRGESDHPRYWNDDGKLMNSSALKDKINYAEGLELSRFSAMKKTRAHKPQREKQRLLIRMIYHQEGVQYEGDLENIEAIQAAKNQKQGSKRKKAKLDSGKMKNTTPRKTQKTKRDSDLILQQFRKDASNLPATPQFAKRLRAIMEKHLPDGPPPTAVIHAALQEAHAGDKDDACKTRPYMRWALDRDERFTASGHGDDEDSEGDGEDDEGEEEDQGEEEDEGEEEESEHEEYEENLSEGNIGDGNDMVEEHEAEQEEDEDEMSLGAGEKKDDSNDGGDSDDSEAGVRLHGTFGGSDQVPSPTASEVATQSNQLSQGSSGTGTRDKNVRRAHDAIFAAFNYWPEDFEL